MFKCSKYVLSFIIPKKQFTTFQNHITTTSYIVSQIENFKFSFFKHQHMFNFRMLSFQIIRPGFHFGSTKKSKVATKTVSYKRYGEILFQKVAQGYELPFVQGGSSKNVLKHSFLHKYIKNPKFSKFSIYKLPIYRLGRPVCY